MSNARSHPAKVPKSLAQSKPIGLTDNIIDALVGQHKGAKAMNGSGAAANGGGGSGSGSNGKSAVAWSQAPISAGGRGNDQPPRSNSTSKTVDRDRKIPAQRPRPIVPHRSRSSHVSVDMFKNQEKDGEGLEAGVAFDPTCLEVVTGLGRGGFSAVMLARQKGTEQLYALKVFGKDSVQEERHRRRLGTERGILESMDLCPFISRLYCAFQTEVELFFLMEYCAGGDMCFQMHRIFNKIGSFSDSQARFYLTEILLAIEYLHSRGYIHRDIKPENIMLDSLGHVKLIDFGLCKRIRDGSSGRKIDPAQEPMLEPMSPCGSLAFVPPETLRERGSFGGDWWGFGVLAFEFFTGRFPWKNTAPGKEDALRAEISRGAVDIPAFVSEDASSLILALLERDVTKRLGYLTSPSLVRPSLSHPRSLALCPLPFLARIARTMDTSS